MPLGKKLAIGSDEARRQRAELRTSYGNKCSNMNLGRLRGKSNGANLNASASRTSTLTMGTASLRRIASSFAQVSDVVCGSFAALPHEDSEDDVKEELAEVLIRSEPFKPAETSTKLPAVGGVGGTVYPVSALVNRSGSVSTTATVDAARTGAGAGAAAGAAAGNAPVRQHRYDCSDAIQSRASERWGQIACTVSALFRVRRISHANPLSELRRLREQRDLLEAFTRPFLYEDGAHTK